MKRLIRILFALLAIGIVAPAVQAQWTYYYPYGGYYYHSYWYPYYYSPPVVIYDPIAVRQQTITESMHKLNRASDKLLTLTSLPATKDNLKEIKEQAKDVAKYAERIKENIVNRNLPDTKADYVSREVGLAQTAQTINRLTDEVNRFDINIEVVNMSKMQEVVALLNEIEARARSIEALLKS
ncbi:MAG: hypothetical protein AB1489_18990 [Acidobacteriota bacterium]